MGSVLETDRRVEAAVLRALEKTDVPVPRLRWADLNGEKLDRPVLVMDLAAGSCDSLVLNGERPLGQRLAMAHEIYDLSARIHLVDWQGIGLGDVLENPGPAAAMRAVDHWESELRRVQLEPEPELAVITAWLRVNAPESRQTVLVHGDFKPGNVLLEDDRVTVVLDWETAHLGDPHEDLGWVTNPLRAGEHRIPGVWQPEQLLAALEPTDRHHRRRACRVLVERVGKSQARRHRAHRQSGFCRHIASNAITSHPSSSTASCST